MGVRDEAGLRLGDAFVGELLPRALIQRVMYGADQGVRHVAAVPAQCRAVALDEGGVFLKDGVGLLLRLFEYKARCGGLADAGRAVQQKVLRIGRGNAGGECFHGLVLSDDLRKRLRADDLKDRRSEADFFHRA